MPQIVDLKKKPFYLNNTEIAWIEDTINRMTTKEKIGQLFLHLFDNVSSYDDRKIKEFLDKYPVGGARYESAHSSEVQSFINRLQKNSKIPLLVAANCDAGGNGACTDGTYVASGAHVEAANSENVAYNVGYVSGKESTALGVNWNFDPCVDILKNWRNTIINTRAYGSNANNVIKHTDNYIKGLTQNNILPCIKHFPGDGVEEADQHLQLGVNDLSVDEWDNSFGKVYKHYIDKGIPSIMSGHIALPHYQKYLTPGLRDEDVLPASIAPELINDLLKEKLNFNGLVVTDASHMIGLAASMKRKDYVPRAIAAGCDMFLFFNDTEEDFQFMLDGYYEGVITDERLYDALRRILGMKVLLGLPTQKQDNKLISCSEKLSVIGSKTHKYMAEKAADLGITLVKNTKKELPINPNTHKRAKLYWITNDDVKSKEIRNKVIKELENAGFIVTLHTDNKRSKGKIKNMSRYYDVAFVFADIQSYAIENNVRINWGVSTSNQIPWYIHEIPTIFVSLNYTTHLTDVPMVKNYINAYKNTSEIIHQTIKKIVGDSDFKGTYNENVFCNKWSAKL